MTVADKLGLGPTRDAQVNEDGSWTVSITPPKWVHENPKTVTVRLTADQYERYLNWLNTSVLIQRALPDLPPNERELLLHGLDLDFLDSE